MTTCIIQAHMGSSRLPGKVLLPVGGRPLIERVVHRVSMANMIDRIVVAMPAAPENDVLERALVHSRCETFRHVGHEWDVLERYVAAANAYDADPIVRVTSDCPLIDPGVLNALVTMFEEGEYDYVANNLHPSFPHGLDAEVFSRAALHRASADAEPANRAWREHVTEPMRQQPEKYRLGNLECPQDLSRYRLTVDWSEDLEIADAIYSARGLGGDNGHLTTAKVLWFIDRRPDLLEKMSLTRLRWQYGHAN